MAGAQKNVQNAQLLQERFRHSLALLILLDLLTLGLYSVVRSFRLHAVISAVTRRRAFSVAFLQVLAVLNILLAVLRYSRGGTPSDTTLLMARVGVGLLGAGILLAFRRSLQNHFSLRIKAWPLAVFGFWYLQFTINQAEQDGVTPAETMIVPLGVIALSLTIHLGLAMLMDRFAHSPAFPISLKRIPAEKDHSAPHPLAPY